MDSGFIKGIMIRLLIITTIALCYILVMREDANADMYGQAMVGVFHSAEPTPGVSKLIGLGYRSDLPFSLTNQVELGGWSDSAGHGRSSSAYGAYQIGVEAKNVIVGRFMFGPSLISSSDSYLGGRFQFTEDLFLGIDGNNDNMLGFKYKHFSSAGIEVPNVGRDFMGIEISIPF